MIKAHEGLRLKPYKCTAGRWTIGYGHNLEAHNEKIPISITLEQAEKYLDADIASAETQCRSRMPYFSKLDDVRKAVLVDMCFNLGLGGLLGFKQTLGFVAAGNYATAASQMLNSKWATQVRYRAVRLSNMMSSGKWPNEIRALAA
jgi:lysozyme